MSAMKSEFYTEVICLAAADNVCVALHPLACGAEISVAGASIRLADPIPAGHKIALRDILPGEQVIKYGYPIGHATAFIPQGAHVHTHNIATNLGEILSYDYAPVPCALAPQPCRETFWGYVRSNGDVGIRNELWIVPTVGCVDAIGNRIMETFLARMTGDPSPTQLPPGLDDVKVLTHPYGCGQEGYDSENTQNALAMAVKHPNAGAVLVLGLGCEDNRIEEFKKVLGPYDSRRVRFLETQQVEDEISEGADLLEELYAAVRADKRTEVPLSMLRVGMECGGSDGFSGLTGNPLLGAFSDFLVSRGGSTVMTEVAEMFGAETILMNRAVNRTVYEKVVALINDYKQYCFDNHASISGNPSLGNLDGGISTLEDKALGCTQKGGTAPVVDVLEYAHPLLRPGFQLLCAPGSDTAGTTALGLCCQMVIFTTGRGTPYGGFIPTVKVATNSEMYRRKKNWNDFDAGRLVDGVPMASMLEEFVALIRDVASGRRLTKAEKNGFKEFVIWKNGISE